VQAPSVSPELVKRIQHAAGRRFDREVEPAWDALQNRWVILAYDQTTRQMIPWIVVCNEDGTYRALDDRMVKTVAGTTGDIKAKQKKRLRDYKRKDKEHKRTFHLIKKYGLLNDLRERRLRYCEESAALDSAIEDVAQELQQLHGSDDAIREAASMLAHLLSGKVSVGASSGKETSRLWTPGN